MSNVSKSFSYTLVAVMWVCHGIQSSQLQRSREVGVPRDPDISSAAVPLGYPWAAKAGG